MLTIIVHLPRNGSHKLLDALNRNIRNTVDNFVACQPSEWPSGGQVIGWNKDYLAFGSDGSVDLSLMSDEEYLAWVKKGIDHMVAHCSDSVMKFNMWHPKLRTHYDEILAYIKSVTAVRVIKLTRANISDAIVSSTYAGLSGKWAYHKKQETPTVTYNSDPYALKDNIKMICDYLGRDFQADYQFSFHQLTAQFTEVMQTLGFSCEGNQVSTWVESPVDYPNQLEGYDQLLNDIIDGVLALDINYTVHAGRKIVINH